MDEKQEIEHLERAFLMFGLAENDEQLQQLINSFLCPVILKMASKFESVRDKAMEILSHMNKQLQNRTKVQIPVTALLELLDENASVIKNFALVYLKLGIPRIPESAQVDTLPLLTASLIGKTPQQMDSILQLFTSSLVHITTPINHQTVPNLMSLVPSKDTPQIRRTFLDFLLWMLLLPYNPEKQHSIAPPGLSNNQYKSVTGYKDMREDLLEKVKLRIISLLSSSVFDASEVLVHFIVGSADPKYSVSDICEQQTKLFADVNEYENPTIVSELFIIFLGNGGQTKRSSPSSSSSESFTRPGSSNTRSPGSLRMRLRILPFFLKSTVAANSFPSCAQVMFVGLFGAITNTKLRLLCLEFAHHIISRASSSKLQLMNPLLMTAFNKVIDMPESKEEKKLLLYSYNGIGHVAKKSPPLLRKDSKYLRRLFEELTKDEDKEIGLAVQQCISTSALAYRGIKDTNAIIIEALILDNIKREQSHCRLSAAYCARVIFPFSHIPSRYVSLLACGDAKQEVKDEGKNGLCPSEEDLHKSETQFPSFDDLVEYIHIRAEARLESDQCYSVAAGKLPYPPDTMASMFIFLHRCMVATAGCGTVKDLLQLDLTAPLEKANIIRVKEYLKCLHSSNDTILQHYIHLITLALSPAADSNLISVGIIALLQVLLTSPYTAVMTFVPKLDWIKRFTQSSRNETKEAAGRIIGYLASQLDTNTVMTILQDSLKDTHHPMYPVQESGVIVIGKVGSVCVQRLAQEDNTEDNILIFKEALRRLVTFLDCINGHIVKSACNAIGDIARTGPLPFPAESSDKSLSKLSLFEKLEELMVYTDKVVDKEKYVLSLGYFSLGEPHFPYKEKTLEALVSLREQKSIDLHFSVGEALSCVAAGQFCDQFHNPWDYSLKVKVPETLEPASDMLEKTLSIVIDEYGYSSSPRIRQSACVWMLSLLQHCQNHPSFQKHLPRFQQAFLNLLSDPSDVLQEVASRGLGMLYDLSDSSQKQQLVDFLVGTLMEGKRASQPISGDTKLFPGINLGKSPEGSGLSTYKELCSLASDMNQPDLIYKFMNIANHHAIWNSKKGAAFGVFGIASQAREQLAPYLPTLVPRLYRYKYDPIPRIQLAMNNIWNAVVPESMKTIDKYFNEILKELIINLGSSQWRNRESSCLALRDLLVMNTSGNVSEHLPKLWELCLRARDDIKETVRKAADLACKTLLNVTMRVCDGVAISQTGATVIKTVLPVFMNQGLTNPAQEVRAICLNSLVKIVEKAGPLTKPHIPQLIPLLLESLSSLEPQVLNTISLRMGEDSEVQEQLETLRVAASKTSPLMEAINLCIPQIDNDVLIELIPRIVDITKSGVGLGTKVASAQFLMNLSRCSHIELSSFAGKLLGALLSGLSDRSSTVRKSYAKAIGHLVKVARESSVTKLVEKLKNMYLEKGDSTIQSSVAYTINAIVMHSPDVAKGITIDLLPLVFLAMHIPVKQEDPSSEAIAKTWSDSWQELVSSTSSGVKLYLGELVQLVCPSLSAQSWEVKRQAASALATLAENMGSDLGPPHLAIVLRSLLDGLQGRLWDGKDVLLTSLKSVCKSCSKAIIEQQDTNQPKPSEILSSLLSQCKKENILYKTVAIETTGQVIDALKVDVFEDFYKILLRIIESDDNEEKTAGLTEDERETRSNMFELKAKTFEAIGMAWPADSTLQTGYHKSVCNLLSNLLPNNTWKLQTEILKTLTVIFTRCVIPPEHESLILYNTKTIPSIIQCLDNPRYFVIRQQTVLCVEKFTSYLECHDKLNALDGQVIKKLSQVLRALSDEQLKEPATKIATRLN